MKKYTIRDKKNSILPKISLILIWFFLSLLVKNDIIIPGIGVTLENILKLVKDSNFTLTILMTFFRTLMVFFISTLLSVVLASLSSVSEGFYSHIRPVLSLLASVPILALILLALIWLNVETVAIFVGIVFILPLQFEKVLDGINSIDEKILQMAKVYKVKRMVRIKDIYIPSILIALSSIANSTMASALKMVIAGEVLSQPRYSIGSNLILQKTYLNTPGVFAWIIIILLMSKALTLLIDLLRIKAFPHDRM